MAKVTLISTLGWANYTLYEALPKIKARGFKKIEIASFPVYCFHLNQGSPTPSELKSSLDEYDMTLMMLHWFNKNHNAYEPENIQMFVDEYKRKFDQVAELKIPMMSMVFGERNDRSDQELQLKNALKAYDTVAEIALKYDIRMVIEVPHVYTIMPRPEQVYWLFDNFSSTNIGALVDCSHWGIIGYDIDEFFSRLGDRFWHIHLRDSKGKDTADRSQELEFTPGDGEVDFVKFGRALDAAGYKGDVSLEFEYRDMTLDAIENEYDKGLQHLVKCGWQLPAGVRTS